MRRLFPLVGAIVFVDTMFFAALTPLLPHYAHLLGLSKAGSGILQAAYPAGVLVGAVPAGLVAARFGVKPTVVAGLLCLAAASVAVGFADTTWTLDGARLAQGLASSLSWTGSLAWLVAASPTSRRGELIGSAFGLAIGGALFGPVLGGIASQLGSRATFTAVGAVALGQAAWAWSVPAVRPGPPQPARAVLAALRRPRILAAMWLVLLPGLLFGSLGVLAPLRLSHLGFGSVAIGATWLTSAALEAVVAPLVGRLSDRHGRRLPTVAGLAGSAVVLCLLPWPGRGWLLAAVVVLAGIAFGIFWSPAMSLLSAAADEEGLEQAWAFAMLNLAWAPGQVLGAAAGGTLAKSTSDTAVYLLLAGICALTLAVVTRAHGRLPARA